MAYESGDDDDDALMNQVDLDALSHPSGAQQTAMPSDTTRFERFRVELYAKDGEIKMLRGMLATLEQKHAALQQTLLSVNAEAQHAVKGKLLDLSKDGARILKARARTADAAVLAGFGGIPRDPTHRPRRPCAQADR